MCHGFKVGDIVRVTKVNIDWYDHYVGVVGKVIETTSFRTVIEILNGKNLEVISRTLDLDYNFSLEDYSQIWNSPLYKIMRENDV